MWPYLERECLSSGSSGCSFSGTRHTDRVAVAGPKKVPPSHTVAGTLSSLLDTPQGRAGAAGMCFLPGHTARAAVAGMWAPPSLCDAGFQLIFTREMGPAGASMAKEKSTGWVNPDLLAE